MKEDLKLPDDAELAGKIKDDFKAGKDLLVTVVMAMGMEKCISYRETNSWI